MYSERIKHPPIRIIDQLSNDEEGQQCLYLQALEYLSQRLACQYCNYVHKKIPMLINQFMCKVMKCGIPSQYECWRITIYIYIYIYIIYILYKCVCWYERVLFHSNYTLLYAI